jgi:hypothetical protein
MRNEEYKVNYTPVSERGLARTQEFFNSSFFKEFYEKEKREDGYNHIKPGLPEAEIDGLVKLCNERFGCPPPQGWLALLRIMNGYYRIHGYKGPVEEDYGFIHTNTYNLENGYFCDDEGKLIYLIIGWEDESYYGYNLQTGKYVRLGNVLHDEYQIFHSFADVFLNMAYNNFWDDDYEEIFHEFVERTKAEDLKLQEEQLKLGDRYYAKQDYTQAVYWYRESGERETGSAEAQYKLGLCYSEGQGVEQDVWEAAYLYWRAAEQGFVQAQVKYAYCCKNGIGTKKDEKKAAYWLKKTAGQAGTGEEETHDLLFPVSVS